MVNEDAHRSAAPHGAKRRALIVAPQSFFVVSGTPINVLQMARALAQLDYEVHLITLPLGENITLDNVIHHRVMKIPFVKNVPVGFSLAKIPYNALLCIGMVRLLLKYRFSVVHGIEESAFYTVALGRLFRIPAICDLDSDISAQLGSHPSAIARLLSVPAGLLRRWSLRGAEAAITVAPHLTKLVKQESPGTRVFEIRDIPMEEALRPPDADKMADILTRLSLTSKRLVVYTGNFDRRQGLIELVKAMKVVLGRYPDATLVIVGGKPEDVSRIGDLARDLDISRAVRLVGVQAPDTMPEFMGIAAALASPRLEPLVTPLKIYSYMASGRPIVATDLPTHTDVLDAETAILTPATPEGLAEGIIEAFDDPVRAESLGRKAKATARDNHTFAAFKEKIGEAYAFAGGKGAMGRAD